MIKFLTHYGSYSPLPFVEDLELHSESIDYAAIARAFYIASRRVQRLSGAKFKMDLPMIVHGSSCVSRPDSGSEENIMALNLASQLGPSVDGSPEHQKEFRLGSGKIVKAVGRVSTDCSFVKGPAVSLRCKFYVFNNLTWPLIMGMSFLEGTEMLSKNRYRLQPQATPPSASSKNCILNNPKRRLLCIVAAEPILASADTGSEVNLISLAYCRKQGFVTDPVDPDKSSIQFADGSVSYLSGSVDLTIMLGHVEGIRLKATFYVLEDLTCDILLGEDLLNETDAFHTYENAFSIEENHECVAEVNTIV